MPAIYTSGRCPCHRPRHVPAKRPGPSGHGRSGTSLAVPQILDVGDSLIGSRPLARQQAGLWMQAAGPPRSSSSRPHRRRATCAIRSAETLSGIRRSLSCTTASVRRMVSGRRHPVPRPSGEECDVPGAVGGDKFNEGIRPAERAVDPGLAGLPNHFQDDIVVSRADNVPDDRARLRPFDAGQRRPFRHGGQVQPSGHHRQRLCPAHAGR